MKKIIIALLVVFMMGCSRNNAPHKEVGIAIFDSNIYEICMPNGVVYYASGTYRFAPKFNKNSKVETCDFKQ